MKIKPVKIKAQLIQLNISSTFVVKNRCRTCSGAPGGHYVLFLSPYYFDVRSVNWVFDWYKKYIKRMTGDWYLKSSPSDFHKIREFNYYPGGKYKAALHQHTNIDEGMHVIEFVTCACGRTIWAFNEEDGMLRPEIKHRKGRYKYPQKFESY